MESRIVPFVQPSARVGRFSGLGRDCLFVAVLFWGPFWLVLSTVVVAPTTCKSSICLITCKGLHFDRIWQGGVFTLTVGNCPESHKPVGIGYLSAPSDSGSGDTKGVHPGAGRPLTERLEAGKGETSGLAGLD